ncbi:MAG: patatin-like phospholipase family protein [Syntrophales bacterium]
MRQAEGNRKRVGLALGGGGSRGFAHIGVLKVIEEEDIPIEIIAGTSIGAVIGGAYAGGLGQAELVKKVEEIVQSPLSQLPVFKAMEDQPAQKQMGLADKIGLFFKGQWLFTQALFNPGMIDGKDFETVVNHFVPDIRIEETKIPFRAVAADLIEGKEAVLSSGSLRLAVMASCAVPGFMPPVRIGGMLLVDGGIVNMMPCSVARRWGAEAVIGVDVDRDIGADREFRNAIDIYTRAAEIGSRHLANFCAGEADLVIRPRVGEMKWFDLSRSMEAISEGERSAWANLELIRKLASPLKKWPFSETLHRLFRRMGKFA